MGDEVEYGKVGERWAFPSRFEAGYALILKNQATAIGV